MTSIERTAYPRFKPHPSASELEEVYSPTPEEVRLGESMTRGKGQLLGFLLMLKSFQRLGYFPMPGEVPEAIVSHLRSCVGLSADTAPALPERSRYRYHAAIRQHLGVEAYGDRARRVAAQAMGEAALAKDDPRGGQARLRTLLPRRWVVERDFASEGLCPASRFRRLVKDYERLPETVAGLHFVAFACLFLQQASGILLTGS